MPEIKNNFIQGKMNKDLDDRLLPNGQYRDAQNILITKSDNSDVGAIQNVRGNIRPYDLWSLSAVSDWRYLKDLDTPTVRAKNAEVIGAYVDNNTNKVYYFVTNRSTGIFDDLVNPPGWDTRGNLLADYINYKNPVTNENTIILDPNKDNHTYHAIYVWDQNNPGRKPDSIVSGRFLNFSKDYLITGINIIDDLLFWTDNLNQPRRINVKTAINDPNFYNNEIKISVCKFAPFQPIRLLNSSNYSTMSEDDDIISDFLEKRFVRFSYRFKYKDGEYSTMAPFTQPVFIPNIYKNGKTGFSVSQIGDIMKTFEVEDMVNYVKRVVFQVKLPSIVTQSTELVTTTGEVTEDLLSKYIWLKEYNEDVFVGMTVTGLESGNGAIVTEHSRALWDNNISQIRLDREVRTWKDNILTFTGILNSSTTDLTNVIKDYSIDKIQILSRVDGDLAVKVVDDFRPSTIIQEDITGISTNAITTASLS